MRILISVAVAAMFLAGCSGGNDPSQQAEIERLKAETEKLRAEAEQLRQQNAQRQAEWEAGETSREINRRLDERHFGVRADNGSGR
jgi:outer membrane murein-binding lipoprotein Lpp